MTKGVYDRNLPRPEKANIPKLPKPEVLADFNEFLTAAHLVGGKGVLDFQGSLRQSNSQFGEGLVAEVKLGRNLYDFTIKFSSVNYRKLHERFGSKPARWRGKVPVTVKEFAGNEYVAVV